MQLKGSVTNFDTSSNTLLKLTDWKIPTFWHHFPIKIIFLACRFTKLINDAEEVFSTSVPLFELFFSSDWINHFAPVRFVLNNLIDFARFLCQRKTSGVTTEKFTFPANYWSIKLPGCLTIFLLPHSSRHVEGKENLFGGFHELQLPWHTQLRLLICSQTKTFIQESEKEKIFFWGTNELKQHLRWNGIGSHTIKPAAYFFGWAWWWNCGVIWKFCYLD